VYAPKVFQIEDESEILDFIQENSLATIVSNHDNEPLASHIPLIYKNGKLYGHYARANSQVAVLENQPNVLLIFSGAHSYVSSYAKDPENLSILPTWDYQIVHAKGKLTFVDDSGLLTILNDLMEFHESKQPKPLAMEDYDKERFNKLFKGIIGFEIELTDWLTCFRLNQNRTEKERENITNHLADNKKLVKAIKKYNQ